MVGRLPLKLASLIVFTISALLFYSGYTLQRRALRAMQNALEPLNTDYNKYHANKHPKKQQDPVLPPSVNKQAKTAYVQLVNTATELCHALTVLRRLKERGSKKEMLVLYPKHWESKILRVGLGNDGRMKDEAEEKEEKGWSETRRLLEMAADMGIKCRGVVDVLPGKLDIIEETRVNPLHLFTLESYTRLLLLSPVSLINKHLDPLLDASTLLQFSIAAPRQFLNRETSGLTDSFLLVTPSHNALDQVVAYIKQHHNTLEDRASPIHLLIKAFVDSSIVLPFFPYLYTTEELLSSTAKDEDYEKKTLDSAVVAFGKGETPWIVKNNEKKICGKGVEDCEGRLSAWRGLKDRFEEGRRGVCGWDWEFKS